MALKSGRVGIHPSQVDPITGMLINTPTPGSLSFEDLSDADITNPEAGQTLEYDGSKWANVFASISPTTLAALQDVQITDPEDGAYLTYDSASSKWVNTTTPPAPVVPEGSTVTPTDDIQTWLACAGITDKTYTTLNEVLADSTTLLALMSDNNAVDYLVRSTTWASGITANSTAMTDIGANNYCANTLLADSTWCTAICNSTYFESVLNVKIPVLTANNQCIASSYYTGSTYETFRMFDGNTSTIGTTNQTYSATNLYVGYDFGTDVHIHKIKYVNSQYTGSATFKLRGSDDNSTYNDVSDDITITAASQTKESVVTNFASYRYWVIKYSAITAASGGGNAPNVCVLQFYGRHTI